MNLLSRVSQDSKKRTTKNDKEDQDENVNGTDEDDDDDDDNDDGSRPTSDYENDERCRMPDKRYR